MSGRETEAAHWGGDSIGMTRGLLLEEAGWGVERSRGGGCVLPRRGLVSNQYLVASVWDQSWPPASGPPVGHVIGFQS